jgi:hypothetical protein
MVLATVTAAAFVLMFLPIFAFDFLEKRQRTTTLRLLARIGFALAVYCVASGIAMLAGWTDAVAATDPSEVAARAFRYWPYGLVVAGGFWTLVYGVTHRAGRRR